MKGNQIYSTSTKERREKDRLKVGKNERLPKCKL
jgi:hypothetical protein